MSTNSQVVQPITPSYDRLSDHNPNNGGNSSAPPASVPETSGPAPSATRAEPERVVFSETQQKRIDEIVKSAMGRAAAETRQKLSLAEAEKQRLAAELELAKAAAAPDATEVQKKDYELQQARQRNAELQRQLQQSALTNAAREAAQRAGFVNLEHALKLADIPQLSEDGTFDASALTAAINKLANENPNLVKGSVLPGSGSGPASQIPSPTITVEQVFGRGSDARLANRLALQQPREYAELKAIARRKGLVA